MFALVVGAVIVAYGVLVAPASLLAGVWIGAVGLFAFLAGLVRTEWAGARLGLSTSARRTLSLAFLVVAAVLFAAFVVVNFASFEYGESSGVAVERFA